MKFHGDAVVKIGVQLVRSFSRGPEWVATRYLYFKYEGVDIGVHLWNDCSHILTSVFLIETFQSWSAWICGGFYISVVTRWRPRYWASDCFTAFWQAL